MRSTMPVTLCIWKVSEVSLDSRLGTVRRSICSEVRYITRRKRSWRTPSVTLRATLDAMRFATTFKMRVKSAAAIMTAPQKSTALILPVGTTTSMICSKIKGIISSESEPRTLMNSPRQTYGAKGLEYFKKRFI